MQVYKLLLTILYYLIHFGVTYFSLCINYVSCMSSPLKSVHFGVPIMVQQKWTWLGTMRLLVQSLAWLSGLRIRPGNLHMLGTWEPPYAAGVALKRQKTKKKKKVHLVNVLFCWFFKDEQIFKIVFPFLYLINFYFYLYYFLVYAIIITLFFILLYSFLVSYFFEIFFF